MTEPPDYWQKACRALSRRDPRMGGLIRKFPGDRLRGRGDAFETLCRAIIGQQISLQAADSIRSKLEQRIGGLTPDNVSRRRDATLRKCGLSENKARFLKSAADFFITERVTDGYWKKHDFDVIRERLIEVKGVGEWTFQMFAIFYLKHPDVYPTGDLGLVKAVRNIYGADLEPGQILTLGESWAPWRTVATWYLWRSIDPDPVVY